MIYDMSEPEMSIEMNAIRKELNDTKEVDQDLKKLCQVGSISEKFNLPEHRKRNKHGLKEYNVAAVAKTQKRVVNFPEKPPLGKQEKIRRYENKAATSLGQQFIAFRFKEEAEITKATWTRRQQARKAEEKKEKKKAEERKRKKRKKKLEDGEISDSNDEHDLESDDEDDQQLSWNNKLESESRSEESSDSEGKILVTNIKLPRKHDKNEDTKADEVEPPAKKKRNKETYIPKKKPVAEPREPTAEEMHNFISGKIAEGNNEFNAKLQEDLMKEMTKRLNASPAGGIFDPKLMSIILRIIQALGEENPVENAETFITNLDHVAEQLLIETYKTAEHERITRLKTLEGTLKEKLEKSFEGELDLLNKRILRVDNVTDVVSEGDEVLAKCIDIDPAGRIRLSRKESLAEAAAEGE